MGAHHAKIDDPRALRALADLIELAPAAILVRDLERGAILFSNRAAEERYG